MVGRVNALGVHAYVWVERWSREDCRRAVWATAEAGFDLIEIPLLDPSSVDVDDTRQVLEEHGVQAACSLGLAAETDISSDDPAAVTAGRRLLDDALWATRQLGATMLTGVLYGRLGRYTEPLTTSGRTNAVATIRELCAAAAPEGITIGLEPVNRYETNGLNTAEQALRFIDDVGTDNLAVHLDTFHMNIEEADLASPVHACAERLGYVHLGESHRGALGTGTVDFPSFFAALAQAGYTGPITFESFSSAAAAPELSSTLCIWRESWTDAMAVARAATRFVHEQSAAAAARTG
jgi:D-psicose/D-tagatose/L-ribulose 3-epimerase